MKLLATIIFAALNITCATAQKSLLIQIMDVPLSGAERRSFIIRASILRAVGFTSRVRGLI